MSMDRTAANGSGGAASLDDLVFQFLEDCEDGVGAPSEVLEALCAEHPGLAPRLRAAVETLSGTGLGLPASADENPGRTIGRFRLLERLGAVDGDGQVALKLLHPRVQNEPEALERFEREARAIERLDHPAIVRLLDHGEVEEGGVATPYLAMAFHRGVSLDAFVSSVDAAEVTSSDGAELGAQMHAAVAPRVDPLERSSRYRGPWWQVVARMGADLASALAHAHERGVVHRDVKPSNVLATADGRVLLLDFGLAHTRDSGRLTRSGAQLGSLPYMAPEQVAGRATDASVDVYGLGLVLYELLTLRPAFDARSRDTLAVQIERGKSLRPSRDVDWIPPSIATSIDTVVERATQCEPRFRYPTARALADDLDALVAGRPVSTEPIPAVTRAVRAARRHPWHVALAGVVLLFLAAGGLVLTFYETRIAEDARRDVVAEIDGIRGRIETLMSGSVGMSIGQLGSNPRFAPSALGGLIEARDRMVAARTRLRELADAGEEVAETERLADSVIADILIGIANAHSSLGNEVDAIEAYERHRDHLQGMIAGFVARGEEVPSRTRAELGRSYGMLARALHLAGPVDTALEEATRSVALVEEVWREGESPLRTSSQLVGALLIRSEALVRAGDRAAAGEALDRAERISLDAFGPDPERLHARGQRGEIELRRVRYGFVSGGRDAVIEALRRSIEWFEGSRTAVYEDGTIATIRLDAGRWLALELHRAKRFDEAQECVDELIRVTDRLVAARGETAGPDDPFVTALEAVEMVAALIRADVGGEVGRTEAMEVFRAAHVRARTDHLERPGDVAVLAEYLRAAGVYANQAVFEPDVEPWEVGRAIEAVETALEAARGADLGIPRIYQATRLCLYARGLALVRAEREREAYEVAVGLETMARAKSPADGAALRMAADLCNELHNLDPESAGAAGLRRRTLDLLEAAIGAGYDDLTELRTTEALDPLRSEPRLEALIERLRTSLSDD